MPAKPAPLKRIAICVHPKLGEANQDAALIAAYFQDNGLQTEYGLLSDDSITARIRQGEFDLMIALGGDGTMLRAGHICGPAKVPILGINIGRFGFLTEIHRDKWKTVMPKLLAGEYWLERRMMLCADQLRDKKSIGQWEVLNEVWIGRGQIVRPVHLDADVDGRFLTTYVADGLIVSTPTGSTAYALAAGGPILPPELRTILLVPVAPHLSIDRSIVLAEGSTVAITVHTDHQAVLCIDGQDPISVEDGDRVNVRASEHTVEFVRFQDPGYFYRNLTPHMYKNPSIRNTK
jgi:NAD+ kinase